MKPTLLWFIFLTFLCTNCWARNVEEITFELNLKVYVPTDSEDETREVIDVYGEYRGWGEYALTAYGTVEKDYWSAYSGFAKHCFNNQLEFGVMVGVAHFEDDSPVSVNPWLFYENQYVEIMIFGEHYFATKRPDYFRGHAYLDIGQFLIGVYGESEVGIGPSLAIPLEKEATLRTVAAISEQSVSVVAFLQLRF